MPTLDAEPDENLEKPANNFEKPTEGSNGKVIKEVMEEKPVDIKEGNEKIEEVELPPAEPVWTETSDGQIEVEDPDDYLIYLEDILKRIHKLV